MITFEGFCVESGMPIYLQIIIFIKRGIIAGIINNDDELPSRRVLSALLGVNPNTVQKAYRILEEEGLICSHSGTKSYMILTDDKKEQIRLELIENDAKNIVNSMRQMGISKHEALELIEKYWEEM